MQSRIPLLEALDKMAGSLPMHMPGHKRNPLWGDAGIGFLDRKLYELDFTEVAGLDDLHAPQGVIGEAQALGSRLLSCKAYLFFGERCFRGDDGCCYLLLRRGEQDPAPQKCTPLCI